MKHRSPSSSFSVGPAVMLPHRAYLGLADMHSLDKSSAFLMQSRLIFCRQREFRPVNGLVCGKLVRFVIPPSLSDFWRAIQLNCAVVCSLESNTPQEWCYIYVARVRVRTLLLEWRVGLLVGSNMGMIWLYPCYGRSLSVGRRSKGDPILDHRLHNNSGLFTIVDTARRRINCLHGGECWFPWQWTL